MKHRIIVLLGAFSLITACQPVDPGVGRTSSLSTDLEVSLTPSTLKAGVKVYDIGGKCNVKGTDSHTIKISVYKANYNGKPEALNAPITKGGICVRGTFSIALNTDGFTGSTKFSVSPYALSIQVDLEGKKKRDVATVSDTQEFKVP